MSRDRFNRSALGILVVGVLALAGCEILGLHDSQSLLVPGLKRSEVAGYIAGFGTTFSALPDLLAMLRRSSSAGMSPRMAAILGASQIAWLYHGLLIASRPVIVWNAVGIFINALTVGAFLSLRSSRQE